MQETKFIDSCYSVTLGFMFNIAAFITDISADVAKSEPQIMMKYKLRS